VGWTTTHHPKSKGKREKKKSQKKPKKKGRKTRPPTSVIFHFPWNFLAPSYFLSTKDEGEEQEQEVPPTPQKMEDLTRNMEETDTSIKWNAMQFLTSSFFFLGLLCVEYAI
jgi:hypothetical protein